MQALVQRVKQASVQVDGKTVGAIGAGLLVLLCVEPGDSEAAAERLLVKLLKMRIFNDADGRMSRSVQDEQGGLLVVSQFTLAADLRGGNRPSFSGAADPALARALYAHFLAEAKKAHPVVEAGIFAADMQVALVNDGPVTIPMRGF